MNHSLLGNCNLLKPCVVCLLSCAGYFSQFGRLKHVRLSRSKKTGKAKHYAFLEFNHASVAKIAAGAMDGYFLFTQVRLHGRQIILWGKQAKLFDRQNFRFEHWEHWNTEYWAT